MKRDDDGSEGDAEVEELEYLRNKEIDSQIDGRRESGEIPNFYKEEGE